MAKMAWILVNAETMDYRCHGSVHYQTGTLAGVG